MSGDFNYAVPKETDTKSVRTKACASEEKHNWKYANLQSSFKQVEGFDHVSVRLVHLDNCEKTTAAGARGLRGHAKPLLCGLRQ